jgi:hypothetical protein
VADDKTRRPRVEPDQPGEEIPRVSAIVADAQKAIEAEESLSLSRESRTREHDTRVDEVSEERATHRARPVPSWVRPSSLDAPPPRPGMVQRWIRTIVRGADDPRNVNQKMREGWRPREISTIPETYLLNASKADAKAGHFVMDDLLLCEMPQETYDQRAAYYRRQANMQMAAVEHDLEAAGGRAIERNHTSKVSHPPRVMGRRVEAAGD